MAKAHYEGTKVETTQEWHMVKSLSAYTMGVHATKFPNVIHKSCVS